MPEQDSTTNLWTATAGQITTGLGALGAVALLLSVAHEYTYFDQIGLEFFPILTPGDFLLVAVFWLPITCSAALLGFWVRHLQGRSTVTISDNEARFAKPLDRAMLTIGSIFIPALAVIYESLIPLMVGAVLVGYRWFVIPRIRQRSLVGESFAEQMLTC